MSDSVIPLSWVEKEALYFKAHKPFSKLATAAMSGWDAGWGSFEKCTLMAIKAAYEMGKAGDKPDLDIFLKRMGVNETRATDSDPVDETEEVPETPEEDDEPFAERVARLAAEARAKPKKRRRRT